MLPKRFRSTYSGRSVCTRVEVATQKRKIVLQAIFYCTQPSPSSFLHLRFSLIRHRSWEVKR
ncbi:hypothetical protein V2J09_013688 [Rumex salicifolius]